MIVEALRIAEGAGDNCEKKGQSGEKGCWQYMPRTWESFSKKIYGEVREQTNQRERYVTTMIVTKWVKEEGLSASRVALRWNAGGATHCSRGINNHGIEYDSCAYTKKVLAQLSQQ